jgi:3alpha(or 20beta)-hydroxysteroid dehydrogenase
MTRLEGKVAIVTGAARGTGAATARCFVEEGARVVLADIRDDLGEGVAKELGDGALYVHLDVTSEADWSRAVETTLERFGSVDVLVNNAGLLHLAALEDTPVEVLERLIRVNQIGPFLGIKSVIEPMRAAGGGSVVNVASVDGLSAKNGVAAYASTKWAVRGITKVAALELGRHRIRVNAVCPEAGNFEMVKPFAPEGLTWEAFTGYTYRVLPHQKERSNEDLIADIVNMILFLASDESLSCTGGDFPVDSGHTAGKILRGSPGS